tara:strand:- start:66 stop:1214 length:1149 start_codon:yes stop_codon:yes gene_type:complete
VSKIYGVYGDLWPKDTDIYDLLPKPDSKFRGLYTGFIDPRIVGDFALGVAPFFDELLMQHPFINPNTIKPNFSPVESAGQYKHQALKDIMFMLEVEPMVVAGMLNLIPDPCSFDSHLQHQMMSMAAKREDNSYISERDMKKAAVLGVEDLLNLTFMLPWQEKERMIRAEFPFLTDEQISTLKSEVEANAPTNPLILLQDTVMSGSGQLMMFQMNPNYEMALFIAQATGSVIVTDSETRWHEFQRAQHRDQGIVSYPWNLINNFICNVSLGSDAWEISDAHKATKYVMLRKELKDLNEIVREGIYGNDISKILQTRLIDRFENMHDQMERKQGREASIRFLMPKHGFVDNNAQRLLLQSNCSSYMPKVDMVIYICTKEKPTDE